MAAEDVFDTDTWPPPPDRYDALRGCAGMIVGVLLSAAVVVVLGVGTLLWMRLRA